MCVYVVLCVCVYVCVCTSFGVCVCVFVSSCVWSRNLTTRRPMSQFGCFTTEIEIYNRYRQPIVVRQNNKPVNYKEEHFMWLRITSCKLNWSRVITARWAGSLSCGELSGGGQAACPVESCLAVGRQLVVWRVVWRWAGSSSCGELSGGGQAACPVETCLAGGMFVCLVNWVPNRGAKKEK